MITCGPTGDLSDFCGLVHPSSNSRHKAKDEFWKDPPQDCSFCNPPAAWYSEREGCTTPVHVRRQQCELLPQCWAAHIELFGRCLYSAALLLVRSKVTPPGMAGEVQTSKDRQNIWCWQLMPQEGCCLLCYNGFMSSPSENKKNRHWKILLGLSFHKSRVAKSPFLYTGGNYRLFCWNQQHYKAVKLVKSRD